MKVYKEMTCKELTIFLQKVLEKKGLFDDPEKEFDSITSFMQEVDDFVEKVKGPYNLGLRSLLAKRLNLSYVGDFHNGWAIAKNKEGGWQSFINQSGEFIKDEHGNVLRFVDVDVFSDGIAAVQLAENGGKVKFLRSDGTFLVIESELHISLSLNRFSEGYTRITNLGSEILVDAEGNEVRRHIQTKESGFHEGFTVIVPAEKKNDYYQFLNKSGKILNTEDGIDHFDQANNFSDGIAPVRIGQKWHFIDHSGNYLRNQDGDKISFDFNEILFISRLSEGWFYARTKDLSYIFMNKDLQILKFEDGQEKFTNNATYFSEGWALVVYDIRINGWRVETKRFIDKNGKFLRDEAGKIIDFGSGSNFVDGLALVHFREPIDSSGNRTAYLDCEGRIVEFGKQQQ